MILMLSSYVHISFRMVWYKQEVYDDVCMYVCIDACAFVHVHTCMRVCAYVCMNVQMCKGTYFCMYVCMDVCVCTYIQYHSSATSHLLTRVDLLVIG